MITERTIQDMAANLDAAAQRIADLLAERAALLAALQEYLDWGAMTGSDRDLFEDKFRDLIAQVDR